MPGGWFGPVFAYEWLTTSRRWQVYAGRSLFVVVLLLGLSSVWVAHVAAAPLTIGQMAEMGRAFFRAIVFTQLTLVLLAAPAATAGAICQDKAEGKLAQLLITDLADAEIVLGKLGARLVPVLGLVCCALPVLAIGTLLGGIDPLVLTGAFLITVSLAILGCAIAFTFSVWGNKPHEVLLATFAVFTVWLLAIPVWLHLTWLRGLPAAPDWLTLTNPFVLAFAPYDEPGKVGVLNFIGFIVGALFVATVLVALSILRLRTVIIRQADRNLVAERPRGVFPSSYTSAQNAINLSLDRNPALWYESHRKRLSPWARALFGLYAGLALTFSALAIDDCFRPATPMRGWLAAYVNAFQASIGMPLLLITAATAVVEERVRGNLDVLMATPLTTRTVVWAKWWSVFRRVPLLLLLPTTIAAALARDGDRWPMVWLLDLYLVASCAAWTSVGLAISTSTRRLGRAVSIAITLYALAALGWPMLVLTVVGYRQPGAGLASVSPFYELFSLTFSIEAPYYVDDIATWTLLWIAAYSVIAVVCLGAALAMFNRSLGRTGARHRARASAHRLGTPGKKSIPVGTNPS
jgi:ABC-type transport system involved in multi-copper enzyme maturation permease subunit